MSDQTAITPYNRFKDLVKSENVQDRFRQLLDKRSPEFLASLLSLVSADKSLIDCEPVSILTAAAKAAILRLPIAKELGFAYIVPFKREATFICGYKGLIQLAIRTGQYLAINAAEIYQGEEVIVDRLTGNVKLNGKRTGDEVTGYVAYFKMKNGFEKFIYLSREDVAKHARRYSKSYGNDRSAWTTNFDDMGKKTVLRLLLGKYGLLSIEMQDGDAQEPPYLGDDPRLTMPHFDAVTGEVLDGEFVQETDPHDGKPPIPSIEDQIVQAGLSENAHAAANALKLCKLPEGATDDQRLEWMRVYRGWRDLGADSKQASANANKGEKPK